MKRNILKGVLSALEQEDCVVFIGSGISMWSGLPSWSGLLHELADFVEECGEDDSLVRKEIENGDLLQAASYGFDKLTKTQIGIFMNQVCRCGQTEPQDIHKKILGLGPKSFITTNYDQLIEMGISKWWEQESVMVVTNRQLSEMGRIVQARANNFVYKPHGDVGDVESIILTREQYRSLLLNGERHMALETLKSIMVSRPVVYIGFGLRDPDFLYIRDILSNIFQGNVRDHYAIMADVTDAEIDYWRRNYGIHLIGYETQNMPNGVRSHQPLLDLIELLYNELHEKTKPEQGKTNAEILLALMRYTSHLERFIEAEPEFGIRVHRRLSKEQKSLLDKYSGRLVEELLVHCEEHVVLIGVPGSGKSYAMRRAAKVLARNLYEKCLYQSMMFNELTIPVYIDLKLYDGNLKGMIEKEFSKTLSLGTILSECKCKIFLDSFNEMPREYWNSGKYQQDFMDFFSKFQNATVIIGSRTIDGLDLFNFSTYYLDEIDKETVKLELEKRGKNVELNEVMYKIITNPFCFQYIINGKIEIENISQPKHFYRDFFNGLQRDYILRFNQKLEIQEILSTVAYMALEVGLEAFPIEFVYEEMDKRNIFEKMEEKEEFVNWLIYKGILIPYIDGKLSFVHQSITEYLAANELMNLYLENKNVINEKIKSYRWDQTVFFLANILSDELIDEFINNLFEKDFELVLRGIRYVELQRGKLVNKILNEIIENKKIRQYHRNDIERSLQYDLPVGYENEENIRKIITFGNTIGGSAVFCLWRLKGNSIKDELVQFLFEYASDYNFCRNAVAVLLSKMIEESDIEMLIEMIDKVQNDKLDEHQNLENIHGFISAIAYVLQKYDVSRVQKVLTREYKLSELSLIKKEILCRFLQDKRTTESLNLATELFMQGYKKASIAMYFIARFSKTTLSWDLFEGEHIYRLIDCFEEDVWALKTLKEILRNRQDLCGAAKERANHYVGITKMAILSSTEKNERIFEELEALICLNKEELSNQSYTLIKDMDLVWSGREELFIKLIAKKNIYLASALMGGSAPPDIAGISVLEIKDIDFWLNWIDELEQDGASTNVPWFIMQLTGLITKYADSKSKEMILMRFNDDKCRYRDILLKHIIPKMNICVDNYSESAIEYIFDDLKRTSYLGEWKHHFLAYVVNDKFVTERIIPMLNESNEILKNNLVDIIRTASSEHGKRYFLFDEHVK